MAGRLFTVAESDSVILADNAFSFPIPPDNFGVIPALWTQTAHGHNVGSIPSFDLAIWSSAVTVFSDAHLYGAFLHDLAFASVDVDSINTAANTLTVTGHGLSTGDGPLNISSAGTLAGGFDAAVGYYVIKVDASTLRLATTREAAFAGTSVDILDAGTGTHTLSDSGSFHAVTWHDYGALNCGNAISLAPRVGFVVRCEHNPTVIAYAIGGTVTPNDPEGVSAAIYRVELR